MPNFFRGATQELCTGSCVDLNEPRYGWLLQMQHLPDILSAASDKKL